MLLHGIGLGLAKDSELYRATDLRSGILSEMYEYKFVRIEPQRGISLWAKNEPDQDYQAIVHHHAAQGWRLVQVLILPLARRDVADSFELIFERLK